MLSNFFNVKIAGTLSYCKKLQAKDACLTLYYKRGE
jgi:hypothetical protein